MKLEVGMYVRTKDGISKCIKVIPIRENSFMYEFDKEVYEDVNFLTYSELEKYKSSSNIIDLIEVGDYVNGIPVEDITMFKDGTWCITFDEWRWIYNNVNAIETIVTKEQFESISYKVGDSNE